jgi:hypothetical protein
MTTPAIQNDFSYYRRTVSRSQMNGQKLKDVDDSGSDFDIPSDFAIRMSLFFAHATPMLKVLSDATSNFIKVSDA